MEVFRYGYCCNVFDIVSLEHCALYRRDSVFCGGNAPAGFWRLGYAGRCLSAARHRHHRKTLVQGLVLAGIILLVLLVLFLVCMRLFSKGKMPKHLVLQSSTAKQEGFSGTPDLRGLVGKTGKP